MEKKQPPSLSSHKKAILAAWLILTIVFTYLLGGFNFIYAPRNFGNNAQIQTCINSIAGLTGHSVWQGNASSISGCYTVQGFWNSSGLILNRTLSVTCQTAFQNEPGTSHLTINGVPDTCSGAACPVEYAYGYKCGPKPG